MRKGASLDAFKVRARIGMSREPAPGGRQGDNSGYIAVILYWRNIPVASAFPLAHYYRAALARGSYADILNHNLLKC